MVVAAQMVSTNILVRVHQVMGEHAVEQVGKFYRDLLDSKCQVQSKNKAERMKRVSSNLSS